MTIRGCRWISRCRNITVDSSRHVDPGVVRSGTLRGVGSFVLRVTWITERDPVSLSFTRKGSRSLNGRVPVAVNVVGVEGIVVLMLCRCVRRFPGLLSRWYGKRRSRTDGDGTVPSRCVPHRVRTVCPRTPDRTGRTTTDTDGEPPVSQPGEKDDDVNYGVFNTSPGSWTGG